MTNMIYMTAIYSNAVFKVVMPEFETFIEKAGLPIPTPVPPAMIEAVRLPMFKNTGFSASLVLTNRTTLIFGSGIVDFYSGPRDFNLSKQFGHWAEMEGTVKMTTNEVYTLATNFIHRLGYRLQDVAFDWPVKIEGPLGWDDGDYVFPFFHVEWQSTNAWGGFTRVCIDADRKEVAGMSLWPIKIRRSDPEIGVEPETWAQHRDELEQKLKAAETNIELTPAAKRRIRLRQSEKQSERLPLVPLPAEAPRPNQPDQ